MEEDSLSKSIKISTRMNENHNQLRLSWSLLNKSMIRELETLGITSELFDWCYKLVTTVDRKNYTGIRLEIPGFLIRNADAWWQGKAETLYQTKATVVWELLVGLEDNELENLKTLVLSNN